MKAEELQRFCEKWLLKAFETGLKQHPNDGENSEFYRPMIGLDWSKEMAGIIKQFAKDKAVGFAWQLSMHDIARIRKYGQTELEKQYDKFINQ